MTRPVSFPFDWIEPGEFQYCQCGDRLVPGSRQGRCECRKAKHVWLWAKWLEWKRSWTARLRQLRGRPPLYWMRGSSENRARG